MIPPPDHPRLPERKIGVLLTNLGTPDAPEAGAVRVYLQEFLSDPRVVEIPYLVWQPILRGLILRTRPKQSAHAYKQVWTEQGSPLAAFTARQSKALEGTWGDQVIVDYAMRYGRPAIAERLQALKDRGCERVLLAPLYPQFCAATTATANDSAFRHLAKMRWQPALRTLPPYHDDPHYIAALKTSVEAGLAQLDFEPDAIIASFHGMPERTLMLGDPYHCHCQKTARSSPRRWGARSPSPSSRASAAPSGSAPPPTRRLPRSRQGGAQGRDLCARLFGRLPGDAGGTGDPRPRDVRGGRRHPLRLSSLPQRQRGGNGDAARDSVAGT
jgi:ferrochelatase